MGFFSFFGKIIEDVATGVANAVATVASEIDKGISNAFNAVAEVTKDIPVLNGITAAIATVVDGATDAFEIGVHHFTMKVAQAGQAVGTITEAVDGVIDGAIAGDLGAMGDAVVGGVGELLETNDEYMKEHIAHDLVLIGLPGKMAMEALSEIAGGIIGDNDISNAPLLLSDAQDFILQDTIQDGLFTPALGALEDLNNQAFGNTVDNLAPSELGMGWSMSHEDMASHKGMDMDMDMMVA